MAEAGETICNFLDHQHHELMDTFEALAKLADPGNKQGRSNLFEYLNELLSAHMAVTEALLFPRLAHDAGLHDAIDEAIAAHAVMRNLLGELDQYVNDLSVWQANCRRLQQVYAQDAEQERRLIDPCCSQLPLEEQRELLRQAQTMAPQEGR